MSTGTPKTKRPGVLPMSFLYRYLLRYKLIFIPAFIALIATAALSLAFPYYLGKLIGSPSAAFRGEVDAAQIAEGVDRTVVVLLIILLVQAVIAFLRVQGFIKAGESAMNDIRRDIFAKMIRLPLPFFHEHRAGELSGRIAGDLEILRETLMTTVPQFVRQFVILIGGMVFLLLSSVKLSLFMLALIPVIVLAIAIFGKSIKNYSRQTQEALSQSNVVVEESVSGIQELKAYTNEDYEAARYETALAQFRTVAFRGAKARAFFISFIIFALFGSISVVAWFGAGMLTRGEITTTEFTHFILFSVFVGASLGSIPEIFGQLQKADGATQRVREILAMETEASPTQQPQDPLESLAFSKVSFSYPSRPLYPALSGVDLTVKKGERIAVVGSSGAGKSTLFQLILGFYAPSQGALLLNGQDVAGQSLQSRRSAIGLVPQDVLLFGGTIAENILYGNAEASPEEVVEAARLAYAKDFIEDFEEGFETVVGQRGVKLSGGQRQRIAIARAILANPELLLLDEATSALDSESERLVQSALDSLMEGRTSIVIAHRLSTIRNCDRIYVMEAGRIVESGSHETLMEGDSRYAHLAQTQLLS